jgi:hypothetical protein
MKWTLERVLFWITVLASFFLMLTLANYMWRFANSAQPIERLQVGLLHDGGHWLFAVVSYLLIRTRHLKACFAVITAWILMIVVYATWQLMLEPNWETIVIGLGEVFIAGLLGYFLSVERRRMTPQDVATSL